MENKFVKLERLAIADSTENAVNVHQEQEYGEDEDEETLSFCDLPIHHLSRKRKEEEEEEERIPLRANEAQEDFDFCYLSKESEMCDANEVFFQGQILPFRHSLSSDKGLFLYRRSLSRSESVDGSSSIALFSSRSSSISSSHRSYSSSSRSTSTATQDSPKKIEILAPPPSTATTPRRRKLPKRPQNHLHSHRGSPPRTNFPLPGMIHTNNRISSKKTSSVWNILRLGILVTSPPDIAFQDLKTRLHISNNDCKNFRSRNCTGTTTNSSDSKIIPNNLKKKPRGFLGGCNCSNGAVDTVRSKVVRIKEKQANVLRPPESPKHQAAKKQGTHYRTFEWLKQLSLEDMAEET